MLESKLKLSTLIHLQTNDQIKRMTQKLRQYLQFFINHKQKNQPEWLAIAKFVVNNKTYSTTKISPFIANYSRKLKMEIDIRRKRKVKKCNRVYRQNKEGSEES